MLDREFGHPLVWKAWLNNDCVGVRPFHLGKRRVELIWPAELEGRDLKVQRVGTVLNIAEEWHIERIGDIEQNADPACRRKHFPDQLKILDAEFATCADHAGDI